jgi:FkbH-like protein
MYLEDRERKQDEHEFEGPRQAFLASLDIHLVISEAKEDDLVRAEELTVRTNQLNATGKTYSYRELKGYLRSNSHKLLMCEMHDKYGSYGKIGLALVEVLGEYFHIKLLLMSCRVMSYGVGTVLLLHIMNTANKAGKKVRADFKNTGRNRVMYVTFKFAGFRELVEEDNGAIILENDLSSIQAFPPYVNVRLG